MVISLKRVYKPASTGDGKRVLVERLWPRGLKKERASIDEWIREVAPSAELRKWFGHDPAKWSEFRRRYWKELDEKQDLVSKLAQDSQKGRITFVFASKEEKHNNAAALKEYIETRMK